MLRIVSCPTRSSGENGASPLFHAQRGDYIGIANELKELGLKALRSLQGDPKPPPHRLPRHHPPVPPQHMRKISQIDLVPLMPPDPAADGEVGY